MVSGVLALEYRWHVILKLLFPSANLGRGNVVLLGDLQDALLALERLGGDTGFVLGGQVSFFSSHRSDFCGDLPLSDQLKFQQTSGSVLRDHFNRTIARIRSGTQSCGIHLGAPEGTRDWQPTGARGMATLPPCDCSIEEKAAQTQDYPRMFRSS